MRRIFGILLTILGGVVAMLVMLTALMMAFPQLVFGATTYYERTTANQSMHIEYTHRDGDLFVALPGAIRPPDDNNIIEVIDIAWDENGFRQPATAYDSYPIAIFGDSFTESVNTPRPYADVVADVLGVGVRNYGYRAYGPREVAQAVEEIVNDQPRDWVIYGYFSGNDLGDAIRSAKIDTSPVGVWRSLFERFTQSPPPQAPDENVHYDFPMPVIIGGNYYEIAFLSYYWWWHTATPDDFANSVNLAVVNETLDRIADATPDDACLLLTFIPTKEQLYYPYIYDTERQWIRGIVNRAMLDPGSGQLYMNPEPISAEQEPDFIASLNNQRNAIQALVKSKPRWYFFDLFPVFEKAVAQGELLYYPYDSHWNQAGHNLAGYALANYLRDVPECGTPANFRALSGK